MSVCVCLSLAKASLGSTLRERYVQHWYRLFCILSITCSLTRALSQSLVHAQELFSTSTLNEGMLFSLRVAMNRLPKGIFDNQYIQGNCSKLDTDIIMLHVLLDAP